MYHIVDDNIELTELIAELIIGEGEDCKTFASAAEYLAYLDSPDYQKPDGVVTDVHMPLISGYEMMDKVLERYPEIKFAVLSGEHYRPGKHRHKACMYLLKPVRAAAIAEMIDMFAKCSWCQPGSETCCISFSDHRDFGRFEFTCPKEAESNRN